MCKPRKDQFYNFMYTTEDNYTIKAKLDDLVVLVPFSSINFLIFFPCSSMLNRTWFPAYSVLLGH